jgi:hypothetical protein
LKEVTSKSSEEYKARIAEIDTAINSITSEIAYNEALKA